MAKNEVRERLLMDGPGALSNADLLTVCGAEAVASIGVGQLAWVSVAELRRLGLGEARAVALAAAFELGRRGAWAPPQRGQRCLDPRSVYELMRPVAHAPVEEFHVVLLDVRGRLLRTERIAQGSLTQCPVNPRDVFRTAVREAAHGIVFVHNHPSGDPAPSPDDAHLTERLRAASELVGVLARDHVIVASGGYFSFVEAGRWRR
jgi:DNA repair protein RadC